MRADASQYRDASALLETARVSEYGPRPAGLEHKLRAELHGTGLRYARRLAEVSKRLACGCIHPAVSKVGIPALQVDAIECVVHVNTELKVGRLLGEPGKVHVLCQRRIRLREPGSTECISSQAAFMPLGYAVRIDGQREVGGLERSLQEF